MPVTFVGDIDFTNILSVIDGRKDRERGKIQCLLII